jgi:hypothetical protein
VPLAVHSGREVNHSPPSGAGGRGVGGAVPPLPHAPSWRDAQVGGAQGQIYLSYLRSNIILTSISRSSRDLPSGFPIKFFYSFHISPVLASCPAHPTLLD